MNNGKDLKSIQGYTFLDEPPLGKGSFGTVYSIINNSTNYPCVAKAISKKFISDRGLAEQMRNEMTIHKKLKHKNIVKYLDQFSTNTEIFIILEKCNSETLEKICQNYNTIFKKQLSLKVIQHFLIQISAAISFIHSKGIAHRDLKLENIMLKFEDEIPLDKDNKHGFFYYNNEFLQDSQKFEDIMMTSVVKIIDLGFAKELDPQGCAKSFLGTPAYLAPEVLKKKSSEVTPEFAYSSKVDTWSIGIITFQILTGDVPFTINKNINTFNELYKLHKQGLYSLQGDLFVTYELLDYINALLQFNENDRINIDDMVEHPFLKKKIEKQNVIQVNKLIKDNSKELVLKTIERRNFLGTEKSFGFGKGDRISYLDKDIFINDKMIDEVFGIHSKITIFEREEDGFIVISTKKENTG